MHEAFLGLANYWALNAWGILFKPCSSSWNTLFIGAVNYHVIMHGCQRGFWGPPNFGGVTSKARLRRKWLARSAARSSFSPWPGIWTGVASGLNENCAIARLRPPPRRAQHRAGAGEPAPEHRRRTFRSRIPSLKFKQLYGSSSCTAGWQEIEWRCDTSNSSSWIVTLVFRFRTLWNSFKRKFIESFKPSIFGKSWMQYYPLSEAP